MNLELSPQAEKDVNDIRALINKDSDKLRLLFVLPESAGDIFLSTSLLPSLRELYHDFDIYYACKSKFFDILKGNPNIDYLIESNETMKNVILMEGNGSWPGLFDVCMYPGILAQAWIHYSHNGLDKVGINLRK